MEAILNSLKGCPSASLCSAIPRSALSALLREASIGLPAAHQDILSQANGITVYDGYFRLFGVGCSDGTDLLHWNDLDTWKFAWDLDLSRFLCFGETAWGDQYAYATDDLHLGRAPTVYYLDSILMKAEALCEGFEAFIKAEFLRCATNPYDRMIVAARNKIGRLDWGSHIIYMPSLLLGGQDSVENVAEINAVAGMIINGDLASQCANETLKRRVKALQDYVDSKGRPRIRVLWA